MDGNKQFIMYEKDFPGGAVVKNLPANAEDTSLIPGLGRFHMPCLVQLSPWITTTEPMRSRVLAPQQDRPGQ